MSTENKLPYLPVIDSLRGLAASMVCFYHFVCTTTGFITSAVVLKVFTYGAQGVQMFFVISGVVIPMTMYNAGYHITKLPRFLGKRFVRIEPPYLASAVIAIAYLYLRRYVPNTVPQALPSTRDILLHLGYLVPFVDGAKWLVDVYWTLAVEFQYYLLMSLVFGLLFSKSIYLRIPIYVAFLASGYLLPSGHFVLYWLPVFLLGIAYVLYKSGTITSTEYVIVTLASSTMVGVHLGIRDLVISLFAISAIYFFSNARNKITGFVGDVSYSLYLLHSIIGAAFLNYMSHHANSSAVKIALVILTYFISLGSAWVLYRLVEKPSRQLSSKLKYD